MDSRKELLRIAHQLLTEHAGDNPGQIKIHISRSDGTEFIVRSEPGEFRVLPDNLTDRQTLILQAFQPGEVLTAKEVARRTGYTVNSHLYAGLSEMVKLGLLEKAGNEGYQVPPDTCIS